MKQFAGSDVKVKVKVTVYADRSFELAIGKPVTSSLILWKLKQASGSGQPNKTKIGKLTRQDLEEIAEIKKDDMNTDNKEAIVKSLMGTAKNMGVEIEG